MSRTCGARGVLGEFCTGSGAARLVLGEICFVVAPSVYAVAGFPPPTGAPSWPSAPAARSTLVAVGVLHYTKPSAGVSPACRASNVAILPDWWRRGRDLRGCGRHSAAPLGENSQMTMVLVEWVCVLAGSVSVVVRCSHVNPLLRAVTRSIAREPAT